MPTATLELRKTALALAAATVLGGCAQDLPDPRVIIDHRVLAIRTAVAATLLPPEDPELVAAQPKAQALPFETVEIAPFIVGEEAIRAADRALLDSAELRLTWEPTAAHLYDGGTHGVTSSAPRSCPSPRAPA